MADVVSLGFAIFAAFSTIPNCSTSTFKSNEHAIVVNFDDTFRVRKFNDGLVYESIPFIHSNNQESSVGSESNFAFITGLFKNRLCTYEVLFKDFDENEQTLLKMIKEDKEKYNFGEFLRFVFMTDNYFVSESFLSLIFESDDINILDPSIHEALTICSKSKRRAISKKASSILRYYFDEGVNDVR